MKGILGRKVGMTSVFLTNGKMVPVTVVEVSPNVVLQIKTVEKDGYNAIKLGAFDKKERNAVKAEKAIAQKASTMPKRFLKEIKNVDVSNYEVGKVISADLFTAGEMVDVTGTSKGKGFAGVIKRWNQSRGPMTHGSDYHRKPGSLGPMRPMRVLKGKKLPGHLGNETTTIQNLEIISIDMENNCILVSGNIPGPKGGYVFIRSTIKGLPNREAAELVSYEEIVDEAPENEVIEETAVVEELAETTEETKEEK